MNVNIRTQINVVESIGSIRCQDQRFQDDGENLFSVRHFFFFLSCVAVYNTTDSSMLSQVFSVVVRDQTGSRTLLRYLPDFVELQCKVSLESTIC